jgi:hypothetical protein
VNSSCSAKPCRHHSSAAAGAAGLRGSSELRSAAKAVMRIHSTAPSRTVTGGFGYRNSMLVLTLEACTCASGILHCAANPNIVRQQNCNPTPLHEVTTSQQTRCTVPRASVAPAAPPRTSSANSLRLNTAAVVTYGSCSKCSAACLSARPNPNTT